MKLTKRKKQLILNETLRHMFELQQACEYAGMWGHYKRIQNEIAKVNALLDKLEGDNAK